MVRVVVEVEVVVVGIAIEVAVAVVVVVVVVLLKFYMAQYFTLLFFFRGIVINSNLYFDPSQVSLDTYMYT